ncbi:TOTE conflict system archaeo-eukaryotic primase domain-containing protein [Bifidobacterium vespertilionis]|uniref:DEAD/DEAH box helicase n=1 Tax=Bifidobacterium vespertilionis TaxID=2562524 RepID=A0A5J5E0E3_9BIFI|nr:DEAD/DEAH box helicase [Bifidobacterium vespertilionis]KAA8824068.1 DEAD/DEAH box helicase [Bifidobacterium vespertilionis]
MPNDDARAVLSGRTYRFIRRVPHVSGDGGIVLCAPCDGFGEDGDGDGRLRYVTEYEWRTGCKERDRRIRETGSRNDEAGASCDIPAVSGDSGASGVPPVTARSSSADKIALFRSLFRGRDDVYAHGFVNAKTGKMGYAVAAWNEWTELADGKRVPTPPERRRCKPLSDQALVAHFTGRDPKRRNIVGLYPLSKESKVWFLAIDFDDGDWQREITAVARACEAHGLRPSVERSRSGDGGHLWLFFTEEVEAAEARRMGSVLLTEAASQTHITFRTYDRMFPNQDVLPAGGFGNLIALPLQRAARDLGNSVFVDVDHGFKPYPDQWAYLAGVTRVTPEQVRSIASLAARLGGPLGRLVAFPDDKSQDRDRPALPIDGEHGRTEPASAPASVLITEGRMLSIPKEGFSAQALNAIRRLAAFANPDFHRAQAMRQPVYNKPRIIYCGEETDRAILLPRGCRESLEELLRGCGTRVEYRDERTAGKPIQAAFNGMLRPQQREAADALLAHHDGILVAPTGFGKTVIAANLIASRGVNTLVVLRSSALMDQWRERLGQFLDITADLPPMLTKTGRVSRKRRTAIGRIGGGHDELSGIIDIALAQSLFEKGDVPGEKRVKSLATKYGMVIFDECHHVAAADNEAIARTVTAEYVYGLTGTPKRDDGLQPIAYMQCGPIRHIIKVSDQMADQHFARVLVPRFSAVDLRLTEPTSYHDYLKAACDNDERNRMIIDDAMSAINGKRTPLVLTKRIEHAKRLAASLRKRGCRHVILLHGADPKAVRKRNLEAVRNVPDDEDLAVVATGSYIGEGFDCGRLDTLLLAAPVSVEGAVAQYVGRLHRDSEGKHEVRVYDYIDVTVPMSAAMYRKRLKAYAHQGYAANLSQTAADRRTAKEQAIRIQRGRASDSAMGATQGGIVFAAEYGEAFRADINACEHAIEITAEYTTAKAVESLGSDIIKAIGRGVSIHVTLKLGANATPAARSRTERSVQRLTALGCTVRTAESCTEHAVFDGELIWFGSLPLLGNPKDDDCSLRFRDPELAVKLARRSLEP